ncbi:DNA-binding transcriptional regulator [Serinicoccus sp. CNJ-927]|uniref:YerC/YecD family TrpR-related protein n=1 Tax=Serinicoccus TaxID=265976 RepID=UPI00095CF3FA|nr:MULTISPECIES: YerC/YecD family TrpR-related protein [Serinicoccus]OLT39385.1 DNA-binding transcriptional regulator [Serinicoccus sp. CNJ-927]
MKQREDAEGGARARDGLARVLAALDGPDAVDAFLDDLCTPAEIEAMADRWSVVPLLAQGLSYRQIHDETGVSVTTVGRIARCLDAGAGGYRAALEHHHEHPAALPTV